MKVNFNQELTDITGKAIEEKETTSTCPHCGGELEPGKNNTVVKGTGRVVKLKNLCINVLMQDSDEKNITADKKIHRAKLAEKIYTEENSAIDIRSEDIAMIKGLVGKLYPPLLVMRAFAILDPEEEERTEEK